MQNRDNKSRVDMRGWLPESLFQESRRQFSGAGYYKYCLGVSIMRIGEIVAGISFAKFLLSTIPELFNRLFANL